MQTWEISDLDGSNKRTVTLAEFLAENGIKSAAAVAKFNQSVEAAGLDIERKRRFVGGRSAA